MADVHGQLAAAMSLLTVAREELMVDACTVTRPGDVGQTPALDDDGNVITPPAPAVYAGPCTISDPTSALEGRRTPNDQGVVPNERVGKLPHTADLHAGDVLTVTASAFSPALVGDSFVVSGEEERSFATYRRYLLRGTSWLSPVTGP